MKLEVVTPDDYFGDVLGDINSRRGHVQGMDQRGNTHVIRAMVPLAETFAYSGANYCFDNGVGMWGLNILIYGSWHFAALLFYTRWDTRPGQRADLDTTVLSGFAALGILMTLMAITKTFIAPHFVDVSHGLRQINDWSPGNCLGPKP